MGKDNINKFMKNSLIHIANLNRILETLSLKSWLTSFGLTHLGVTIVTNKVLLTSDLLIIEKYVKSLENIDSTQIKSPHLPQSKFYLKIIGISYYPHSNGNSQDCLSSNDVETVIKQNQIFNNIMLWQPLDTKSNDHTASKSLNIDIKWEVHKRT